MFITHQKLIVPLLLIILWMALIFALSAQQSGETNHLSFGVTQALLKNNAAVSLGIDGSADAVTLFNRVIRKLAHFFLFFVLGMLVMNAMQFIKTKMRNRLGISAAICFLYAVSDEVHQLFVPGRDSDIKDVMVDTVGAVLGIGLYWLIQKCSRKNIPG